jgi:hypothetical protein
MADTAPDTQQDALYAWEDTFRSFGERSLTQKETLRVIRRCCRIYGVEAPRIHFMPRSRREWSHLQDNDLWMNWHQCNHAIACHEAAHAIVTAWDPDEDREDHGPEFVGVYLNLLVKHQVAPRSALEASLRQAGIRWIAK